MTDRVIPLTNSDFQWFHAREQQMLELACYLVERDDRFNSKNLNENLELISEYVGYVTTWQLAFAKLLMKHDEGAWMGLRNAGERHYKELFGEG